MPQRHNLKTISVLRASTPLQVAVFAGALSVACSGDESVLIVGGGNGGSPLSADGGVPSVLDQLNPKSEAAEIVRGFNQLLALAQDRADYFCECELQTSEGKEFEACLRDQNPVDPPPVLECTRQVLAESPHVLPSLLCEKKINEAYISCVQAAPTCLDFDHITDCEIDRITAKFECEEFPYDVWVVDQKRCWGIERPPAFECANGRFISSELKCDIVDDCGDRSDERDCENDPHAGAGL